MAEQSSIRSLSEGERYVIFELVFDYISDIRTLMSLTLVSKQTRSAVYRSNGLRQLTYKITQRYLKVNEVLLKGRNQVGKLKDGLCWIWTVGKRLKAVRLIECDAAIFSRVFVLPLLNSLAATEKRRIETLDINGIPCKLIVDLVRENCSTLRCLHVEIPQEPSDFSSSPTLDVSLKNCTLSTPPKNASFWSVVLQCKHLESLDLRLSSIVGFRYVKDDEIFPVDLVSFLRHTPLKHLGLSCWNWGHLNTEVLQNFVDVLSLKELRDNLKSLKLDIKICDSFFSSLVRELASSHSPVVFVNVTQLTFDLFEGLWLPNAINFNAFWAIFPAVNEIKNSVFMGLWSFMFSQNVSGFCKTFLGMSTRRSCDIKIEMPLMVDDISTGAEELREPMVRAASLPEDQDWCVSHGVQIQTERHDEAIERVTLRKDTSTLVFEFKLLKD